MHWEFYFIQEYFISIHSFIVWKFKLVLIIVYWMVLSSYCNRFASNIVWLVEWREKKNSIMSDHLISDHPRNPNKMSPLNFNHFYSIIFPNIQLYYFRALLHTHNLWLIICNYHIFSNCYYLIKCFFCFFFRFSLIGETKLRIWFRFLIKVFQQRLLLKFFLERTSVYRH